MPAEERDEGAARKALDSDSFSPYAIVRRLDKLQWNLDSVTAWQSKHDSLAKDVEQMHRDYKAIKRLAWMILAAVVALLVGAVWARFSFRIADPPPVTNRADRLGTDRIERSGP